MRRRWLRLIAVLVGVSVVWSVWHLGWLQSRRSWRRAIGLDRLEVAPQPVADFEIDGEPLRLDWLGHAGWILEWAGTRIAIDPTLASHCTVAPRQWPAPAEVQGPIDAALISHAHRDHLDPATLRRLEPVEVILPQGAERWIPEMASVGLVVGASTRVGELEIVAVAADHHGHRQHPIDSAIQALGYVIRHGESALYFAGDTGTQAPFAEIGSRYHPAMAILPIGSFAPSYPIGQVHLDPEQAVAAAIELGRPIVLPSHFGTFVLALDRGYEALPRFARAARRAGVAWSMPAPLGWEAES